MFRRSRHISIEVMPDQLEEAVAHYKRLFGIVEENRTNEGVELAGSNFTIWIDIAPGTPRVLQEWTTTDADAAREAVELSGATVTGTSHCGFYVTDPFGMSYHVFVEDEPEG